MRLAGMTCAVEFRNASWLNEKNAERTLGFLEDKGLAFVMVDEPQGFKSSVPPVTAVTSDLALVRFHGRNRETWEAKGITPAERFRYLYSRDELEEWAPRIRQAASEAKDTHVLMNNCYANYGTTNAREIAAILAGDLEGYGARDGPAPQCLRVWRNGPSARTQAGCCVVAILAALVAFGSRFASKVLTTALGWASTLLFGRVPASRQILLLGITFGSVIWLVMLAGFIVPDLGTFLLLLIPPQDFVPDQVIRLIMLVGVIVVPGVVGLLTLALTAKEERQGRVPSRRSPAATR